MTVVLPKSTRDVVEVLSTIYAQEKATSRQVLLKILDNVQYFGRQGLPLCGYDDTKSNFCQLLDVPKCCDPALAKWLERKGDR